MRAFAGESVAVALHAAGRRVLSRSLKYHRPRAFFCLEGHCGGCLMRIDGVPNLRACMEPCTNELSAEGQNAFPSPDLDLLEAVDWMFPHGMNHHTMMTGSKILNSVMRGIVRQLSGLGTLPDSDADELPEVEELTVDVAVVGAGPAGLAAAAAAARAGARTLVVDEHLQPGGSLLADPRHGVAAAQAATTDAREAGAELRSRATAIAFYPEDGGGLLAVATPERLLRVRARRYLYATGGYSVNELFVNNDRPGVFAARAVGRLLVQHGVLAGERVCVVGAGDYAATLTRALSDAGCEVSTVDQRERRIIGVRGRTWVTAVEVDGADGKTSRIDCDAVAVAATPAPATEAPRQHGCKVELSPETGGFACLVDGDGHTSVEDVLACGDVCGYAGPEAAAAAGARVGAVAAREATA